MYVCIERERKEERAISWYDHFSPSPQLNWFRIITAVSWVFLLCFSEWSSFFYFCSLSFTCTVLLSNHQVIHGNFLLRTLCWWLVKARVRDNFLRPMRLSSRRQPPFSAHRLHSHQCPSHLLESLLFLGHQGGSGTKVFVLAPPWRRRAHLVHTQLGHSLPSGPPSRPPSQRRFHPLFTK